MREESGSVRAKGKIVSPCLLGTIVYGVGISGMSYDVAHVIDENEAVQHAEHKSRLAASKCRRVVRVVFEERLSRTISQEEQVRKPAEERV
jgi:hypothetical protein